jgi:hypothetical protein
MAAPSRACDPAPRWPKRSLCTCGTLRPALTPPGSQIPAESASRWIIQTPALHGTISSHPWPQLCQSADPRPSKSPASSSASPSTTTKAGFACFASRQKGIARKLRNYGRGVPALGHRWGMAGRGGMLGQGPGTRAAIQSQHHEDSAAQHRRGRRAVSR